MTHLLEKAYMPIAQLPEAEQDRIAEIILLELEDEAGWEQKFAASVDVLS